MLEHFRLTPGSIAYDEELNLALFEWIEGEVPSTIESRHINQALIFVEKLKDLFEARHNEFPEASEACLSTAQLFSQVQTKARVLLRMRLLIL